MKCRKIVLALTSLLLTRGAAAAGAASATGQGVQAVGGGKLVETLVGLVLVLALIFLLARVLRRMQNSAGAGSQVLRVVSSLSVGTRERILLLKVADKHILVAATTQTISPLHVFDEMPEGLLESEPEANGFADLLQSISSGGGNR
jgi:flagellar protein FliO/FliZ